jgi:processing peptidase subunit alpha
METPKSTYTGGDFRQAAESDVIYFLIEYSLLGFEVPLSSSLKFCSSLCLQMTHVALAFEVPGGWLQERDVTIMTVIQVRLRVKYL